MAITITITTTAKSVTVESSGINWGCVKSRMIGRIPYHRGIILRSDMGSIDLPYDEVLANGEITFSSAEELQEWVESNCFNAGSSSPGTEASWDTLDNKPSFIAAGSTAAAARNAIGLGSAATRPAGDFDPAGSALNAEANAKSYADSIVAGLYRWIGSVETLEDLPEDAAVGDVYDVVSEAGMNYAWTGTVWDKLGSTFIADWNSLANKPTTFAPSAHTHDSNDITDASETGKSVLIAESQSAARSAIGAGTSNLAIGTTGSTAMAGNSPVVKSQQEGGVGTVITNHIAMTQAQYDALATKNSSTVYEITT